jgi:hypothetical protein
MVGVTSSAGGRAELEVMSTLEGVLGGGTLPFAGKRRVHRARRTAPRRRSTCSVNGHDRWRTCRHDTVIITITQAPALGVAIVSGGQIIVHADRERFRQRLSCSTPSALTAASRSRRRVVAITVTNVNDAPVAVHDTANGVGGLGISVPLLANDTDPDGAGGPGRCGPRHLAAGLTFTVVGGSLNFTAPAGTYTFT